MPITTPEHLLDKYNNDSNHFLKVLEEIFIPSVTSAGFNPIIPLSKGAELIQVEIIKNLFISDIVLCDISAFNPNVFFELGVRTALNKPVCYVKDNLTKAIPFDNSVINHHTYNANIANDKSEIIKLSEHINNSIKNPSDGNVLWKYFGIPAITHPIEVNITEKIDLLITEFTSINNHISSYEGVHLSIQEFLNDVNKKLGKILELKDKNEKLKKVNNQENRLKIKIDTLKNNNELSPEQLLNLGELLKLTAEIQKLKLEIILNE